jgi:hypothetical protein
MKHQIKHRYTGNVLFECELPDDTPSGLVVRHALEKAVFSGSDLSYSDLRGSDLSYSNLSYSDLRGSDLSYSNLSYSDLRGSDLSYSNLSGSDLSGSNLSYSNLSYSNLSGSNLSGKKLIGERPYFCISPIGSRSDSLIAWVTDKGVFVSAGCFVEKTLDEFREKLEQKHGDNIHAKEYKAALLLIEAHAELWTPKNEN